MKRDTPNNINFLPEILSRSWSLDTKYGVHPISLFIGQGTSALEVAVAQAARLPNRLALIEIWKARKAGRAAPLLLVVLYPGKASVIGATGETPPVYVDMDVGQIERLCREVLSQPDRHSALLLLSQALPTLETALPGLTNEGLLALHELEHGVPARSDWNDARHKAKAAATKRSDEMLGALGFKVQRLDNLTSLLRSGERSVALAVMLRESETAEAGIARFNSLSPISYALKKADDENLNWVILTQGNRIRLYSTTVDSGVGRRGRTETYIECQSSLLSDEHLAYLWLIYSAEALAPNGSLHQILGESQRFAGDLAIRLRERIYNHVVPELAQGIAVARGIDQMKPEDISITYELALTVLFRLLFIAYAEDRDLLPYRFNDAYRTRSLKQKAQELADFVAKNTPIATGDSHWQETSVLWQAVAEGNPEWDVPAYDGRLFSNDEKVSKLGAELARITLSNECFETALRQLIVIETPEGVPGPVDFRSLGVREFGTIYEGLLESELAVATNDLIVKEQRKKGKTESVYVPAGDGVTPDVLIGEVYLHNRSGARKSTGSYYTKPFVVGHLLNRSLEPALTDHFARLGRMDDTDATEAFFDLRVADIAMGSGHFLIGAIDRIEKRMADYLASRHLPGVHLELDKLRSVAINELGELGESTTIEDGQLLRRMIARRCIYGVDLNGIAVQLARLAVWIHTFVPGLPLSFLDHNLVHGNALVGIGALDEIKEKFKSLSLPLFPVDAHSLLGKAVAPLRRLANVNDVSLQEVARARAALAEAREAIRSTEALCDLISAQAISENQKVTGFQFQNWKDMEDNAYQSEVAQLARRDLADSRVLHFPVAFPEVFLGARSGFDVILGNPPWQEATIEEDGFWARHFPGFQSLPQPAQEVEKERLREERPDLVSLYEDELKENEQIRKVLVGGAFPGMGTGDPDLYKAFCWRFWNLTTVDGGRIGVVLPRSALAAKGSEKFRREIFSGAAQVDVTMLVNNRNWVFPEVHPQYSIGLACIKRGVPEKQSINFQGPYASKTKFIEGITEKPTGFKSCDVLEWNDSASLPLLPTEESIGVFAQLRKSPRLDLIEGNAWRARPDCELHATNDKPLLDLKSVECPEGFWPVFKGASFNLWNPDTGTYYAWGDPKAVCQRLQGKRLRGGTIKRSAHSEFPLHHLQDPTTLPCFAPRVAFRDVTNRTNQRTVIACLVPPKVFITNKGPYLLWPRGDEKDQAFLLGTISSIPLDWYARRFVELNLNFFILNPFPIPRPSRDNGFWKRVVQLAGRLACPDKRFSTWANAVGVEHGPLATDEKEEMIYELDAVVAQLYGLSERQLVHIFETFHEGWNYQTRLDSVLQHFRIWRGRE